MRLAIVCPLLLCVASTKVYPAPWCAPSQRYDVHQFPPRCLDCPSVALNPMHISKISTAVRQNVHTPKLEPGVPQNNSCGCWRGVGHTSIEISLNASWIVSGLTFPSDRTRWLRRFSVAASGDNTAFIDWGNYTQSNASAADVVLFRYPIRARYFRLVIFEYINHMVNDPAGFPLLINALDSESEPFVCNCASLPTGECCPSENMEVKNGTCVMCMDPGDINTVMANGCGKCRSGTVQAAESRRCVATVPNQTGSSVKLQTSSAVSNGDEWAVHVDIDSGDLLLALFLTGGQTLPCTGLPATAACFADLERDFTPVLWDLNLTESSGLAPVARTQRQLNRKYIQFDRGKWTLAMKEGNIRSWAECGLLQCTGNLVALFITAFRGTPSFIATAIRQPLAFEIPAPRARPMVCSFMRRLEPTAVEIQFLVDSSQYLLLTHPVLPGIASVQWDESTQRVSVHDGVLAAPPPAVWASMRVYAGDQQYTVAAPASVATKSSVLSLGAARDAVWVDVSYGLALKHAPDPGDSEQLTTISAFSKQPIRLTRLSTTAGGVTTVYTTSKGFISDPTHVLDLVVACSGAMDTGAMNGWLGSALGLMDHRMESFADQACARVRLGGVTRLYWLVPCRPIGVGRGVRVDVTVSAEFL